MKETGKTESEMDQANTRGKTAALTMVNGRGAIIMVKGYFLTLTDLNTKGTSIVTEGMDLESDTIQTNQPIKEISITT